MYVLPKVEYQAYYGVEALTESEICRLWTESLLHSKCSFYVGKFVYILVQFVCLSIVSGILIKSGVFLRLVTDLFTWGLLVYYFAISCCSFNHNVKDTC